jgi:hypothetical protein
LYSSDDEDDKSVLEVVNKDNKMPRDGQSQQHNTSTPQMRGTRRKKIRDEEEQNAHLLRVLSIRRETQWLKRGLHIIEFFPSPNNVAYMILILIAMPMLDFKTLASSAIQISSSR